MRELSVGLSGVARATIYRRCRSWEELALAVLIDLVNQQVDVGEVADDAPCLAL